MYISRSTCIIAYVKNLVRSGKLEKNGQNRLLLSKFFIYQNFYIIILHIALFQERVEDQIKKTQPYEFLILRVTCKLKHYKGAFKSWKFVIWYNQSCIDDRRYHGVDTIVNLIVCDTYLFYQ